MLRLRPTLSKEYLLSKVSQEQIFERFLGIPVEFGKSFCSPIRKDNHPDCKFFQTRAGVILYCDWADGKYNCFDMVQRIYSVDYVGALAIIAQSFNIEGLSGGTSTPRILAPKQAIADHPLTMEPSKMEVKVREWTKKDMDFWSAFGIGRAVLQEFEVYPLQAFWAGPNLDLCYIHTDPDPCYAYFFGPGEYKLYMPMRKRARFRTNGNFMQGIRQLPAKGEKLIITKSLKDIMVLRTLDIPSIAPSSEAVALDRQTYGELSARFPKLYSLYDFDRIGVRTANLMRRELDIPAMFLTNGRFKSINFGAKDISDYRKRFGHAKTLNLVEQWKTNILS